MYMVDYSGVNVQVPGKVNYWRRNQGGSKGIQGGVCQLATLPQCNTNTLPVLQLNDLSRLNTESCRFDSENDARVLRNNRMYLGRNVAGQMSARRDCYQLVATVILLFFLQTANITDVVLFALAFYKMSHAVVFQHLVAMYYWQKMSFIMIWFHIIQIFVLFIYYIYY